MIKNPDCAIAVEIGKVWWCSLATYGWYLCHLQSPKPEYANCQWKTDEAKVRVGK